MHQLNIDPRVLVKLKNEALNRQRHTLCRKMEPHKYYALLRQLRVFDEDDQQQVSSKVTEVEKCSLLLDKLQRRDDAFDILKSVLSRIETQNYVLQILEDTLQSLIVEELKNYHGDVTVVSDDLSDDEMPDLPLP